MNLNKLFILITMITITHCAYGYKWTMNNFTKHILLVQVELLHSSNAYFVLIPPQQSGDFDWTPPNVMAGFCLGKIKYLIPDNKLWHQTHLVNKNKMEVLNTKELLNWLDKNNYVRKEAQLRFIPDELYDQTVKEAKRLVGTDIGAKIVTWISDVVAKSKCRSRDISIVEKKGDIGFYTHAN